MVHFGEFLVFFSSEISEKVEYLNLNRIYVLRCGAVAGLSEETSGKKSALKCLCLRHISQYNILILDERSCIFAITSGLWR